MVDVFLRGYAFALFEHLAEIEGALETELVGNLVYLHAAVGHEPLSFVDFACGDVLIKAEVVMLFKELA